MTDTITLRRDGIEATVKVGDVVPMTDGSQWTVGEMMEPYCGHTTFGMKRDAVFGARYRIDGVPLITGGVPWIDIAKLAEQQRAARPAAEPAEAIRALAERWQVRAKAHAEWAQRPHQTDGDVRAWIARSNVEAEIAADLLRLLGEGDG